MDSSSHARKQEHKVPVCVRLCGRYLRALPWVCVPLILSGITIFILCHHYSAAVGDGAALLFLQKAGPLILAATVALLVLGIIGSCYIGTYISNKRRATLYLPMAPLQGQPSPAFDDPPYKLDPQ